MPCYYCMSTSEYDAVMGIYLSTPTITKRRIRNPISTRSIRILLFHNPSSNTLIFDTPTPIRYLLCGLSLSCLPPPPILPHSQVHHLFIHSVMGSSIHARTILQIHQKRDSILKYPHRVLHRETSSQCRRPRKGNLVPLDLNPRNQRLSRVIDESCSEAVSAMCLGNPDPLDGHGGREDDVGLGVGFESGLVLGGWVTCLGLRGGGG